MNTALVSSTPTLTVATLHGDGAQVPVPAPSSTVQGRVNYKQPQRAEQSTITDGDAKRLITNGLTESLRAISQLEEPQRTEELQALVRGSSLTGFVQTVRNQRVDSVDGLRALIFAIHRMTTAKVFDHGSKHLFFFAVPRGWLAFAGDVKTDSLVRFYLRKDRKLAADRAAWEKARDAAIAAGQPVPPEVPTVNYTTVPGTNTKWGPWVTLLRKGTHPDYLEMPVIGPNGVQREFKPVMVNENAPLHKARTLTFVVDTKTGRLLAWQAGRYVSDMTPAQRMDRVILAGDVTSDEELSN